MAQPYSSLYILLILVATVSTSAIPLVQEKQIIDRPETSPLRALYDNNDNTLIPRATTQTDTLPTPFDTSLGTNYTSNSCPKFFSHFLSDSSFQSCHALSLLLRNSNSFFTTLHSAPATAHLLDTACSASVSQCSTTLSAFAKDLVSDDNCGEEYRLRNPNVVDAYVDLLAYEPLYRASCLKNPATDEYCFVDAATNSSNPADYDVYFVPFGNALEDNEETSWDNYTPSCNACLRATMDVYKQFARVDGQPLVRSYLPSARVVDRHCGGGFADLNVTVGAVKKVETSGVAVYRPGLAWVVGGVLALGLWG